jgi:glycosyltransferase involved in cell wall biosynthesis
MGGLPEVATVAECLTQGIDTKNSRSFTVCHFTIAHTELKSRSFHREFAPLAAACVHVRYLSPAANAIRSGIEFVSLRRYESRLLRLLSLPFLLFKIATPRADVYHFQDPELMPVALALKVFLRKRVIYDAYEDFPAMAARTRLLPRFLRPLAARAIALVEYVATLILDGVMTADPLTLRRLARVKQSRKLVFYNFPNLVFFPAPTSHAKRFDLVYRGGLSERTGAYVLLKALGLLVAGRRNVRALLIGYFDAPGAERHFRTRICDLGLAPNVEIRGRLEHENMAEALTEASIAICPLQDTQKFQINIPVKIFEYWACGLPVIASDLLPIRPFFRNYQAGILFPAGNASALAESIAWLLDHPAIAKQMGVRGRELVLQRFNNFGEVAKFHRFLRDIVESRNPRQRQEFPSHD